MKKKKKVNGKQVDKKKAAKASKPVKAKKAKATKAVTAEAVRTAVDEALEPIAQTLADMNFQLLTISQLLSDINANIFDAEEYPEDEGEEVVKTAPVVPPEGIENTEAPSVVDL